MIIENFEPTGAFRLPRRGDLYAAGIYSKKPYVNEALVDHTADKHDLFGGQRAIMRKKKPTPKLVKITHGNKFCGIPSDEDTCIQLHFEPKIDGTNYYHMCYEPHRKRAIELLDKAPAICYTGSCKNSECC